MLTNQLHVYLFETFQRLASLPVCLALEVSSVHITHYYSLVSQILRIRLKCSID